MSIQHMIVVLSHCTSNMHQIVLDTFMLTANSKVAITKFTTILYYLVQQVSCEFEIHVSHMLVCVYTI